MRTRSGNPATLNGKVVAVTGAAQGIGREIARALALAGARVGLGDLDGDAARATAAALNSEIAGQSNGAVEAFNLDVTDTASFTAFLADVESTWGPIEVLVNNAGVMWVGSFDAEPENATRRQLEVNLHGVIRGVKLAAATMQTRGRGHIVTIASAASKLSPPGESTYAATKHGVYGYLKGVRTELAASGVQLSIVMPGVVDTELAAGTATGAAKMLRPADVAHAVVAVIERPRFEVSLPAFVGPLTRLVEVLPQWGRDFMYRKMLPDQVAAVAGSSTRESYESRLTGNSPTQGES